MKHKKYLRKQVDGEDTENVSDDKEDEESNINLNYIKKEDLSQRNESESVLGPVFQKHLGEIIQLLLMLSLVFRRHRQEERKRWGRDGEFSVTAEVTIQFLSES